MLPLQASGRLGLVHFQFPPWLVAGGPGRAHVEHCVLRMGGFDLGVEFRHWSWFDGDERQGETLAFLRQLGVGGIGQDLPGQLDRVGDG